MRRKTAVYTFLFLVLALALNGIGCSMLSQPSDAAVLKAIDDSGLLKRGSFTVTSPLVITERLKRNKDGSWPVRVKMTISMTMLDGKTAERENTATFRIFKAADRAGRTVWKARLGS
jgi:hypothetical protein